VTALARLLIRRRVPFGILLAALTLFAGWRALHLEFDLSFRTFFLDSREDAVAQRMADEFGDTAGSSLVAVLQGTDMLRPDVLAAIDAISRRVAAIPHVTQVFSLSTVPYVRADGDALSLTPLGKRADAEALRTEVLADPLLSRRLLSPDGTTTVIAALLAREHKGLAPRAETIAAFRQMIGTMLPPGVTARFTGYPVTEAEYARLVVRGFLLAQIVGLTLMGLTLWYTFRTWPAVILPLVTVGISTILVLGYMELVGQRLTFTNTSVPLMMLVIGVAEVSFFIARYHEEVARDGWSQATTEHAMAVALWPAFVAAATTSAGFLALGASHLELTRDFGFNMSVAGLMTFFVAAMLIPGALVWWGPPPARAIEWAETGPLNRFLEVAADFTVRWPRLVILLSLMACALGALGATRLTVEQFATRELPADHPLLETQRIVDGTLSGVFQTHVGVEARDGGTITRPAVLRQMKQLEDYLVTRPGVVRAWSVADYLIAMHRAAHAGNPPDVLPDDQALVAQYLLLLSMSGDGTDVSTVLDGTEHLGTIALGTTDLGTERLRDLRRDADRFIHDRLGDALDVRFVGDYWEVSRGNDMLARDQAISLISSFVLILPLVAVFLRSFQLTLLCIPPNVLPVLAALGLMGVVGYPLRTGTSIVLPVSLGIAVDTTTHFLTRVREEWLIDRDYPAAVRRAMIGTGWGMTSSTLALVMGFCAYQVPEFQSFHHVGILSSWTMIAALAANLFLTPALVLWRRPFGPGHTDIGAADAVRATG
jgi:predicted RND superfamily exporter protein